MEMERERRNGHVPYADKAIIVDEKGMLPVEETITTIKPLKKKKRKHRKPQDSEGHDTSALNGSLTHPWSGPLEAMEGPESYPGPYKTALFWVRRSDSLGVKHPGNLAPMYSPQNDVRVKAPPEDANTAPWHNKVHKKVYLKVTFRKVGQIDTVNETFNADVIIQARWLLDTAMTENGKVKGVVSEWNPKLYIENSEGNISKSQQPELWEGEKGQIFVIERTTARGKFTETMELDHFPFDCQNLTVTVASERMSREITLLRDPLDVSYLHQGNFVDKQEWHLYEHVNVHEPEGYQSDIMLTATHRPALSFTCQAARRIGYFTWNVFLLLIIIFLMHMCSFSVTKTAFNSRLGMAFTMFLTAIAFKVALNQYLPRISYLTYMDSYLLIQLILMAFVCGWHATVGHLPTLEDAADQAEKIMIILIAIIYFLFQIIFIALAYFIPGKRRRELHAKHTTHRRETATRRRLSVVA